MAKVLSATPKTIAAIRKVSKIPVYANSRQGVKNNIGIGNAAKEYFTAIQSDTNKIKIVNGMNEDDTNCGYVQCNKLAAQAVATQELTITQTCYIFRKSVGSYTADVLTSATVTFEVLTSFPTYTAGTEYELKSVVTFADSAITAFSDMPLPYRIDITGACDT